VPLVLGSPGGLELLIPEVVVLLTPSEDKYRAMREHGNLGRGKAILRLMIIQAASVHGTISASPELELVEIRTLLGRLFIAVTTDRSLPRPLSVVSSTQPISVPSGSVFGLVLLPRCDICYSLLLASLSRMGSQCPCLLFSISDAIYAMV